MSELPNVADAIRLERELMTGDGSGDLRYMAGVIWGVCLSQASQDPYSEDAESLQLFAEVATVSKAQLLHDEGARQASWLNYIRAVARMEATV
jgi:hypothetical protein